MTQPDEVLQPALTTYDAPGSTRALVLVLHGGKDRDSQPVTGRSLSWRRARVLAHALSAPLHAEDVGLWVLRYRTVGWNGDGSGKVEDARWALDRIRTAYDGVPVVLLGHSMGGRTACHVSDDDAVRGVVALAPWLPSTEPVEALRGKVLHAAHGHRDHITRPRDTRAYVERARGVAREATYTDMGPIGHYMLRHVPRWNAFALDACRRVLTG